MKKTKKKSINKNMLANHFMEPTNRKDIPISLIGKNVKMVNLKTKFYNGQTGFVIGFSNERERFKVILNGNDVKYFKAANLINNMLSPETVQNFEAYKKFNQFIHSEQYTNFSLGEKLFAKINCTPTDYFGIAIKKGWLAKLICLHSQNVKNYKIFRKARDLLEKLLEFCEVPEMTVNIKIELAKVLFVISLDNMDRCYDLLMSCVENHYGNLPEITRYFVEYFDMTKTEECYTLYKKSREIIESRNYPQSFESFLYRFFIFIFHAYTKWIDQSAFQHFERMSELNWIISRLDDEARDDGRVTLGFARIAIQKNNFEEAFRKINEAQNYYASEFGEDSQSMGAVYELKLHCYIRTKNKAMAKKCMKKMKKYVPSDSHDFKMMQQQVNDIPDEREQTHKIEEIRMPVRCSNAKCNKKETHAGEFKKCARCRLARYCSQKCQRKDWSIRHKRECQKYNRVILREQTEHN